MPENNLTIKFPQNKASGKVFNILVDDKIIGNIINENSKSYFIPLGYHTISVGSTYSTSNSIDLNFDQNKVFTLELSFTYLPILKSLLTIVGCFFFNRINQYLGFGFLIAMIAYSVYNIKKGKGYYWKLKEIES